MTREDYMSGRVSHQAYYLHLARRYGLTHIQALVRLVATEDKLRAAYDQDTAFNTIPLAKWDRLHPIAGGLSMSDSVCIAKAVARFMVTGAEV